MRRSLHTKVRGHVQCMYIHIYARTVGSQSWSARTCFATCQTWTGIGVLCFPMHLHMQKFRGIDTHTHYMHACMHSPNSSFNKPSLITGTQIRLHVQMYVTICSWTCVQLYTFTYVCRCTCIYVRSFARVCTETWLTGCAYV